MSTKQEFWKTQEEQFKQKLSTFEECAARPFVPGELEHWLKNTEEALRELSPQLQLQTQHIHAEEFAEIAEEDPELFGRVESMREEDQSLADDWERIGNSLEEIKSRLEGGESETDLKEDLDDFVSLCLEFVTRVRKQEVTVRTWLVEAFTRDRGDVD
jgi:hypothetical protein